MEKTKYFTITEKPSADGFCADGFCFQPVDLGEEEKEAVEKEIAEWELIDTYKNTYEDLSYDDKSVSEGERVITDDLLVSFLTGSMTSNQVRGGYLLKDKHFTGYVLLLENTTSFGMAVSKNNGFGILFIDGRKAGKTSYHYFHSSTEISESEDSEYTVRKK